MEKESIGRQEFFFFAKDDILRVLIQNYSSRIYSIPLTKKNPKNLENLR